ncbi:MAG: helix-turn-helix domain-containing protein [Armatimonadetes bacterium]|nr:helix-turn-helix domain-containing protein [Armatimonadota bacterium]
MQKQLLKITEAAEQAGVGRTMAYEFVMSGQWPSVKIGRSLRIPLSGLNEWIEGKEKEATARANELKGGYTF